MTGDLLDASCHLFPLDDEFPCQLTGGGHVEYVGADERSVVGRSTDIPGGTVRLDPAASVTATMRTTDTGAYDEERCTARPVTGLRVTPPADAAPTILPSPNATACDGVLRSAPDFPVGLPVAGEGP